MPYYVSPGRAAAFILALEHGAERAGPLPAPPPAHLPLYSSSLLSAREMSVFSLAHFLALALYFVRALQVLHTPDKPSILTVDLHLSRQIDHLLPVVYDLQKPVLPGGTRIVCTV